MRLPRISTAMARPGARGPTRSSAPQAKSAMSLITSTIGEGGEQLEQLGRAVDAAQHQHLDQRCRPARRRAPPGHRAPEAERRAAQRLDQAVGAVEAQHVERAVREVHDPRHAEDQRQAGRHQEQRRGGGQPVQELDDDGGEGHVRSTVDSRPAARARSGETLPASCKIPRLRFAAVESWRRPLVNSPAASSSPRRRSAARPCRRRSASRS